MLPLGILNACTRKARTTTKRPTAMMNDFAHSQSQRAPVRFTRRRASARVLAEMRGTAAGGREGPTAGSGDEKSLTARLRRRTADGIRDDAAGCTADGPSDRHTLGGAPGEVGASAQSPYEI